MANEYQVTCITKPERTNSHEHITHIGNIQAGWRMTREDAIKRIDSKADVFFTIDPKNGKKAYVGVVRPAGRAPYLRTYADNDWNDNLLAMTECNDNVCKIIK